MARSAKPAYFRGGPLVEFGGRVRAFRHARGWSQEQLAHRAHLHATYVSSVERGERNISLLNILVLGEALDVDAGAIVTRDRAAYLREVAATRPCPARGTR